MHVTDDGAIVDVGDPRQSDRTFRRRLACLVGLAATVRVVHLITKWNRPLRLNDSVWYSSMAAGLRNGEFFQHLVVQGAPSAEHPPLAAVVMAPGSFLPNWVQGQRLTTVVVGTVGVLLIGLLGRRVGGTQVGLVAAGIAAVYPNLWMNDSLVMSESIAITVVVGALLILHRLLDQPKWSTAAAAGLLLGAAALTRSELLLLTPLAAVLVIAHGRRRQAVTNAAIVVGTALLTIMPWAVVNLVRFDRPVLLTTNDGTTLLGSYCDDIFSGANKGGWSVFCVFDAPQTEGDDSVRSAAQRSVAVTYARTHLAEIPGVVVARVARTLDLYGLDDMVHGDVGEEKPRTFVWAGIISWWLLLIPAAVGFTLTRRRDRWLLALPIVSTVTATVVFYGGHRLRAPAEPAVVIFASVAICAFWQRRRQSPSSSSADGGGDHAGDSVSSSGSQASVGGPNLHESARGAVVPPLAGHLLLASVADQLLRQDQPSIDRRRFLSWRHHQHWLDVTAVELSDDGGHRVGDAAATLRHGNHQDVGAVREVEVGQVCGKSAHVRHGCQLDEPATAVAHVRAERLVQTIDRAIADGRDVTRTTADRRPHQPRAGHQNDDSYQTYPAMAGTPGHGSS